MIDATPYANVAGVTASIHAGADVTFIDAFTITWGRANVLGQPTPATATVRLLDLSAGATLARRRDLIGLELDLGYYAVRLDVYGPTYSFVGRITDVTVTRRAAGGFYVELAASSREVEAANYRFPAGTSWPAETFAARLARITAPLPPTLFRTSQRGGPAVLPTSTDWGLAGSPDFTLYAVGPATPGNSDVLTLLRELFSSTSPLPMTFDPGLNAMVSPARRSYLYNNALGATATANLAPSAARGGLYVPSALNGFELDAHDVDTLGEVDQPIDSRITRVEVSYLDSTNGYASATATATTADAALEGTIGRRTLSVSSIHATPANAQQLAAMYADIAGSEARKPRLGPLSYRTRISGGFVSTAQRDALLNGSEGTAAFFLGRSFLPALGVRPIIGIVGGSIAYGDGDWTLRLNPAPVNVDSLWAPLPLRLAPALRLRDIHPSLTFGDAGYLDARTLS